MSQDIRPSSSEEKAETIHGLEVRLTLVDRYLPRVNLQNVPFVYLRGDRPLKYMAFNLSPLSGYLNFR